MNEDKLVKFMAMLEQQNSQTINILKILNELTIRVLELEEKDNG